MSKKTSKDRQKIFDELSLYKERLPYTIPGTRFTITDIATENDIVAYTCGIQSDEWEAMAMSKDIANSDKNLARVISNVSDDVVDKFIEFEIGIKYIYTSIETGEKLLEIEMSPEKLKEIRDKIKNGELEAYTLLEITQMELSKIDIPSQIDEGVWITDAYIKGHSICYEITVEAELNPYDFTPSNKAEMKKDLIESAKEEWLITRHKKEMIKENVHLVYIYKDNRGKIFANIDISPYDL